MAGREERSHPWDDSTANYTATCRNAQPVPPPKPTEPLPLRGDRITVSHSGKALDVAGASTDDGAGIVQWPWNGGPNQRLRRELA